MRDGGRAGVGESKQLPKINWTRELGRGQSGWLNMSPKER